MSPLSAYSLGVGDLKTSSGLNEPFEAKIDLISATPADLVSLKVFMADNAAFERAGIERNYALSNLKFEVVQPEQGKDYIRVYSSTPIREPFLNFLVEVTWSNGRVYREFTVLLDPPLYDPNRQKLVKKSSPAPVVTKPSTPVIAAETGEVEGVVSAEAFENFAASNPNNQSSVSASDYGPISQSESLWSIAAERRPNDAVSVNQMMMAIYAANPEAFHNNNINGLKRGAILKMPSEADLASLTMAQANNEVKSQHQSWTGFSDVPANNVTQRTETVSDSDAVSQQDTTSTSSDKKKTTPEESGASLKLVSPTEGESVSDQVSDSGTANDNELSLAEETIEALSMENAELKDKLIETESIIGDLNRLIEIQSDELKALKDQLQQIDPTIPEATTPTSTETLSEQTDVEASEEVLVEEDTQVVSGEETTELPIEEVAEVEDTTEEAPEEEIIGEETSEEEVEIDVIDTSVSSSGQDSMLDKVMGYIEPVKTMVMDLIGGSKEILLGIVGLVVVLLLYALNKLRGGGEKTLGEIQEEESKGSFISNLMAKFKKDDADETAAIPEDEDEKESLKDKITYFIERITGRAEKPEEVNFEQGSMISELAGDADETAAPQADMVGETEEITDVPAEEVSVADEVPAAVTADFEDLGGVEEAFEEDDSLQEVNTYLAFEQYDEAEAFVRSAIEGQPNRPDYHLKLLEVFYTSGNKQSYEEEAKALNDIVGGQGEVWDSANAMWSEMSPNRGLFEAGGDDDDDTPAQDTTGGGMLDLTAEADDVEGATESSLDFDIAAPTEMSDDEPEDDNSLNMELPAEEQADPMEATAAMNMSQASESSELELGAASTDDNSLDFDFTSDVDPMADTAVEDIEEVDHQADIGLDMPEPESEEIPDPLAEVSSEDDIATEINATESGTEEEISLDIGTDLSESIEDLSLDLESAASESEDISLDMDIEAGESDENDDTSDLLNVTKSGHIEIEEEQDLLDVTAAVVETDIEDNELDLGLDDLSVPNETEEDLMKHISGSSSTESAELVEELEASDNVIDFDAATATKELEDEASIELDLEISESVDESKVDVVSESNDEDEFSLDLEIGEISEAETAVSEENTEEPVSEFSLDLNAVSEEESASEFSLDLPSEEDTATEMLSEDEDEDVVDFDGTVEIPKLDTAPEMDDDDFDDEDEEDRTVFVPRSASASSQSDEDENAAKLDLAKAYVELGDNDSARSILDEVVETGSEQQKQQASELLSEL